MPSDKNEQRFENILRQIGKRGQFGSARREDKPQTPHDRVLNLLNAFDSLAELTQHNYQHILCYGPMSLRASAWSGAVVWYHSKGYHGYQSLNLPGVWAHYRDGEMLLSIGIRKLTYRAPI